MNRIASQLSGVVVAVVALTSAAVAQEVRYFLPASQGPAGAAVKNLTLWTGQPVAVAIPPVAQFERSDVVAVEGRLVPVTVAHPSPLQERVYSYRVVLRLTEHAQQRLQGAVDRVCSMRPYLQIALDDVIIDGIAVLGCGTVEAGASFVERSMAEEFARHFTDKKIEFVEPTPKPVQGAPVAQSASSTISHRTLKSAPVEDRR